MPLLDATRTTVNHPFWDGSFAMAFDEVHFAAFELFILEDETAVERHDESIQVELWRSPFFFFCLSLIFAWATFNLFFWRKSKDRHEASRDWSSANSIDNKGKVHCSCTIYLLLLLCLWQSSSSQRAPNSWTCAPPPHIYSFTSSHTQNREQRKNVLRRWPKKNETLYPKH